LRKNYENYKTQTSQTASNCGSLEGNKKKEFYNKKRVKKVFFTSFAKQAQYFYADFG